MSSLVQDFSFEFLAIFLEGLPFIFLGTLVSGFLGTFLPANAFERALPRKPVGAVLLAGVLGIVFPVCECAVVPVIRRLVRNGLPASCALTYMLAAPIVNPVTAISTYKAFKVAPGFMTCGRLLLGYLIAVLVGLIVMKLAKESFLKPAALEGHSHRHARNLSAAMTNSLRDLVDVGIYFVIGITLTSFLKAGVINPTVDFWKNLEDSTLLAAPAMMGLAFVLSLCSTSDAFIAANVGNFSLASKLSFLVFGPMMDAKLVFLYATVFRPKFILWLGVGLFLAVGGACVMLEVLEIQEIWLN
ncbi:MAG: permease [Verrucomicrobiales bacterium]